MKTVKSEKILGVKVYVDDVDYVVSKNLIIDEKEERKHFLLEFNNIDEIGKFIKRLKMYERNIKDNYNFTKNS